MEKTSILKDELDVTTFFRITINTLITLNSRERFGVWDLATSTGSQHQQQLLILSLHTFLNRFEEQIISIYGWALIDMLKMRIGQICHNLSLNGGLAIQTGLSVWKQTHGSEVRDQRSRLSVRLNFSCLRWYVQDFFLNSWSGCSHIAQKWLNINNISEKHPARHLCWLIRRWFPLVLCKNQSSPIHLKAL